jgi:hypothetical protein
VSGSGRGRGGPPDSLIVHSEIEVTVRATPGNSRNLVEKVGTGQIVGNYSRTVGDSISVNELA